MKIYDLLETTELERQQIERVQDDGYEIEHINNPSEAVQLAAVANTPRAIAYINNPTEKVQMLAVTQSGFRIRDIKNPSLAIQYAALDNNYQAIEYMHQTIEMQQYAVKLNPLALYYIDNPIKSVAIPALLKIIRDVENADPANQWSGSATEEEIIKLYKMHPDWAELEIIADSIGVNVRCN